jgi:SAM-dependent methyltransferase
LAHLQQQEFLRKIIEFIPSNSKVKMCDLGSLDINGGIRSLIPDNCEYLGVDLELGPNVDIARPAQLLDLKSEQFDFLISSELFEHTPYWKEIFSQMCRLTKPGGIVAFTCAGAGRGEHGTTRSDKGFASPFTVSRGLEYYGNVSRKEASRSVALDYWFSEYSFFDEYSSRDLYFAGLRTGASSETSIMFENLMLELKTQHPERRFSFRYWAIKFLPFSVIDIWLRISNNLYRSIKFKLYRVYVRFRPKSRSSF